MSAVPLIFTSGWASGINAYAVVIVLSLFGRFGHVAAVPPTLERSDVLLAASVLFLCEFLADKIPLLDTVWDAGHTAVRPALGGAIGALMAHHAHGSLTGTIISSALGGGTALISHLVKAGVRIGVNVSPEPASNIVLSVAEDLAVAIVVALALLHPLAAALIAAAFLMMGLLLVAFVFSRVRAYWRNRRARRQRPRFAGGRTISSSRPCPGSKSSMAVSPEAASASHGRPDEGYLTEIDTDSRDWSAHPESWSDDYWK